MRIDGSVPGHVARAYGLKLVRPVESATKAAVTQATKPASSTSSTMSNSPTAPVRSAQPTEKIKQLIAAQVSGPVDFSPGPHAVSASGAMQLYTRSADRIEAATGVQIGRQLDVKV